MKTIALLVLCLLTGCVSAHPPVDPREFALRITTARSVCSATAVAADEIETAAHCLAYPLVSIEGKSATIVAHHATGVDRVRVKVAGITFTKWAKLGKARVGDRLRWYGQPMGVPYVYREGVVVQTYPDGLVIDGAICRGDSGSGLINDAGELVGVISAMTNDAGCTFILAR